MSSRDAEQILGVLSTRGLVTSRELQIATGKSQPTVSRLLAGLSDRVLTLGRARSVRYGLPKSIHGRAAQQPVWWTDEHGSTRHVGTFTLLAGDIVDVDTVLVRSTSAGALPWCMSPLAAQGFLGRLLARRLADFGVEPVPERWSVETIAFAALHLHDAPGAMAIGEPADTPAARHAPLPIAGRALGVMLEALASDVAGTLPAGSSAGGEQPKFPALLDDGRHVLVKFAPPHSTPFGRRWTDLLHAEALAATVLRDHGVECAEATVVDTGTRTCLLSERFDRVGERGRRHVVSIGAVHAAFIATAWSNWAASAASLAAQRRLPLLHAERAAALLQFGRLIGNTDMHSGNLGLRVEAEDLARGRFTLAPVYDMLPMRWRPDPMLGGAADYSPFEPDAISLAGAAATPAHAWWDALSRHDRVSPELRAVAREMSRRVSAR